MPKAEAFERVGAVEETAAASQDGWTLEKINMVCKRTEGAHCGGKPQQRLDGGS